jgi:hypothetical protein
MKKITITIFSFITLVLFAAGVVAVSARGALNAIERQSDDIIGLAIEVDGYAISWYKAALSLRGIRIYPAGKKGDEQNLLASAEELSVGVMPGALLRRTLHAKSVTLKKPIINITENSPNAFNWDVVNLGQGEQKVDSSDKSGGDWHVWIENVSIDDGTLNYRSQSGGHRVRLTNLDMDVTDIASDANPEKLPTKISIESKIDGDKGTLKAKGRLNAFAEGINFKVRARIEDAPITTFHSFYAGQTPFPIRSGRMQLTTKATAKKSELIAHSTARIHDLRVGGGVKGKIVNTFLEGQRGPVIVNVTTRGNLEEGGFSTASAISRGIGAGIFDQARRANPLNGTGEKIKEGTKSMGRSIKGLFNR